MEEEQWNSSSSSSSVDGNCDPSLSAETSFSAQNKRRDFTTELRLGRSLSPSSSLHHTPPYSRDNECDWAPIIKPGLRSFFVKVYMEGVPIGRKLDLLIHDSYQRSLDVQIKLGKPNLYSSTRSCSCRKGHFRRQGLFDLARHWPGLARSRSN
ncbi:Auxin-responsive protein IAA4 [Platanthera zijinensis]|uniref:Auxin-responsive protein n=1 Tax=Platanthera zijinensis TaxID=2320716 RepID=A0AAP0AT55_9ASPA